ncbi:sucrose-phosphate phosphatase [Altericista sp. CCNU0014]|uniref:sucrose-phosphate phosphatase n=1 Tax=Altericista sp. CCNU0014 TaxID=3082949 RepID=UPI00384E78C6
MLITDLDNTLVGNLGALNLLNDRFIQARQQQEMLLVYSTGRSLASYRHLCTITPLLMPDVLITAVGTEIYRGSLEPPDAAWSAQLQQSWDRSLVRQLAKQFETLQPQPDSEQRPFKVSYFLDAADASHVIAELSEALRAQGLSCQLIYSGGKDLDILPEGADKGKAMQFVQAQFEIGDAHTVACGDSGNDIALFGKNKGIIVGNAQPELLSWHSQNPASHRYLATAHYAAGILEGLAHFGVLLG